MKDYFAHFFVIFAAKEQVVEEKRSLDQEKQLNENLKTEATQQQKLVEELQQSVSENYDKTSATLQHDREKIEHERQVVEAEKQKSSEEKVRLEHEASQLQVEKDQLEAERSLILATKEVYKNNIPFSLCNYLLRLLNLENYFLKGRVARADRDLLHASQRFSRKIAGWDERIKAKSCSQSAGQ